MRASSGPNLWAGRLRALVPLGVLVLLCLAISLRAPRFFTWANAIRVCVVGSIPMLLACGMTFVIILGSIDLSAEGTVAVAAVAFSLLVANPMTNFNLGLWALPVPILVGALFGLINGLVHVRLKIPSMIASLGVGFTGIGVATLVLAGETLRINDNSVRALALYRGVLGVPLSVWLAVLAVAVAWIVQEYTRLGRWAYVLGGGEDIARLSGIPTGRVRIGVFCLAGAFFGLGGALCVAQFGQSQALIAQGYLFTTITAVVVGGTALTGGVGGILNSVVGVLVVAVLGNGMILVGVPPYVQQGVQGLLIIVAVALSLDRKRTKMAK